MSAIKGGEEKGTYPETVHPRLSSIPIQALTVSIARQAIHDGPADAAVGVDLESEVIVGAGEGMVVLVDDEVGAIGGASGASVERGVGRDGKGRL